VTRWTHRVLLTSAVITVLVSAGCSGPTAGPRAVSSGGCPDVSLRRTGDQHRALEKANDGGTWDLTGAVWRENSPDPIEYPIRSEEWTMGCIVGGTVYGDIARRSTRDQWYDGDDGGESLGGEAFRQTMTDTPDNYLVIRDAYADDVEDAYDPNSPRSDFTTYLIHVRTGLVRDDCIENEDVPHSMVVRDSYFGGCFTAFAERPHDSTTAQDGSGDLSFTVEDSLVHVRPQRLGPDYCGRDEVREKRCRPTRTPGVYLGSYGIWKWSDQAARDVTVRNTVFRLDMASYSSCQSQEWPAGTYENVTVVWTGPGRYRSAGDCHNRLPKGVHLTTDLSVWRAAKLAWLAG
jgi:hypothetical protein